LAHFLNTPTSWNATEKRTAAAAAAAATTTMTTTTTAKRKCPSLHFSLVVALQSPRKNLS
jgi:hypothetical protein